MFWCCHTEGLRGTRRKKIGAFVLPATAPVASGQATDSRTSHIHVKGPFGLCLVGFGQENSQVWCAALSD